MPEKLVISKQKTWWQRTLPFSLAILLPPIAFSVAWFFKTVELKEVIANSKILRGKLTQNIKQYQQLQQTYAQLQQSIDIEHSTSKLTKAEIKSLRSRLNLAESRLSYYKNIMALGNKEFGVQIERLAINQIEDNHYRFELLLIQPRAKAKVLKGQLIMTLIGRKEGKAQSLALQDLMASPLEMSYQFKYFQTFSGSLHLPEGFQPSRLRATLKPKDSKRGRSVTKSFDWQKIQALTN